MTAAGLRAALWLNVVPQALLGVGLFGAAPEAVFPGIDAPGALCLRIAAFGNVPQVALTLYALRRPADPRLLRALVVAFTAYHVLAGAQAFAFAWVLPVSSLTEPCRGPSVFHPVMALLLLAAGLSARGAPAP